MTRPILQRPSRDKAVDELQDLLNRFGALLITDSDFGSETERRVKEAQEFAKLAVTGIVNQATWDWLFWGSTRAAAPHENAIASSWERVISLK